MKNPRVLCALLALAAIVVYAPTVGFEFVALDDNDYVTENPHVLGGPTPANIAWAFTAFHADNWHPLTWISHMIDAAIFGGWAGGHHLVNVLLHAANAVLLFVAFRRMTGDLWPSAAVAALFALHPLHVESVAWVAERRDVLSTFFWLLAMLAWTGYATRGGRRAYVAALAAFAAGLLSKPMVVTLPFVLLLLDFWPHRRAALGAVRLVREKLPFFALAALSAAVTLAAQRGGGAVETLAATPLATRLANAVVAYATYLEKTVWPGQLAAVYPFRDVIPAWEVAGALLPLAGITVLALGAARKRPYLPVGWLWYLGTLVPVIGLVQVGTQSHADRYTYVPLIGVFAMVAWGVRDLVVVRPALARPVAAAAAAALLACAAWTVVQSRSWRTSETLFEQSLRTAPGSELIHNNYGALLARAGRPADARRQYDAALRANPRFLPARFNLVALLIDTGELDGAASELERILAGNPRSAPAQHQLGTVRARQGRLDDAIGHFRAAHRLAPADPRPVEDLGLALLSTGRADEAAPELSAALSGGLRSAQIHFLLGVAEFERGRVAAAVPAFESALRLDPRHVPALNRLGVALAQQGRLPEAIERFRAALDVDPTFPDARENLRRAEGMVRSVLP